MNTNDVTNDVTTNTNDATPPVAPPIDTTPPVATPPKGTGQKRPDKGKGGDDARIIIVGANDAPKGAPHAPDRYKNVVIVRSRDDNARVDELTIELNECNEKTIEGRKRAKRLRAKLRPLGHAGGRCKRSSKYVDVVEGQLPVLNTIAWAKRAKGIAKRSGVDAQIDVRVTPPAKGNVK